MFLDAASNIIPYNLESIIFETKLLLCTNFNEDIDKKSSITASLTGYSTSLLNAVASINQTP